VRETKFIEQNKEKWADFEQMLRENRHDPDKLNNLFVQITDDLSYARTFYPNRSVRMYLNSLAQRIFHRVYRGKRFPVERLRLFWTDELPQLMWETRKALLLSFSIFVLAFAIGVLSSIINPDFARTILGDSYVDMTLENIQKGDPMAVYKQSGPFGMTVGIAANNLFVALRTAIFGVLASLGTVFIMLYNGIMVGAFQYFFIEQGVFWPSFLSIWIHGTLEISAIIIAGAAGLVAGSGLLFPGTYRRSQAFQISMRRGLKIFVGVAPIIVLAAVFEGFFTRFTETPDFIRAAFIATSLFFVLWYFVWLPWHKARTGGFRQAIHDKELPPDKAQIIDFNVIKNAGEILADTFTVVFRHPKMTLGVLSGTTAVFMLWAFGWTDETIAQTFLYPEKPLGVLGGASGFFENNTAPFLYFLQIGLLAVLCVAAFRALELEMDTTQRPRFSRSRVFLSALPLALIMPLFVVFIRADNGLLAWLLGMAAYPFLGMWAAVIYFEDLNPITALIRCFRLVRWSAVVLGLMTINLMLLFFLFLDTPVWEMTMQLFSWLVPSGGDAMAIFHTVFTTAMAGILLYLFFLMIVLGGALQYFSCREIRDATHLRKGIDQVALTRQIRGLARE